MSGKSHSSRENDPLHGVTLKALVTELVEMFGWEKLGRDLNMNCFKNDPGINSSLKFLRKTPWAREKVELYYTKHKNQADLPDDSVWKRK